MQRLSLSFYEQRQTGDMVVRLTSDIDAAEDFITSAVLGIVLDLLTLVGMMGVMFYLDWRFSLIGLSVAPVLFVIVYRFTRRIKEAARDGQEERRASSPRSCRSRSRRRASSRRSRARSSKSAVSIARARRAWTLTLARAQRQGDRSRRSSTSSSRSAPASCCGSASASCCAAA